MIVVSLIGVTSASSNIVSLSFFFVIFTFSLILETRITFPATLMPLIIAQTKLLVLRFVHCRLNNIQIFFLISNFDHVKHDIGRIRF